MQIENIIFLPGEVSSQQVNRSYRTVGIDATSVEASKLLYRTEGGKNIGQGIMASVASDLIMPSTVGQDVSINHGFGQERLLFMMVINNTNGRRLYITGYTNHMGISMQGSIDPNMELYFDKIIETQAANYQVAGGGSVMGSRMVDACNLLRKDTYGTTNMYGVNGAATPYAQTPANMLKNFDAVNSVNQIYDGIGGYHGASEVTLPENRHQILNLTKSCDVSSYTTMSSISNNDAGKYLTKLLGAHAMSEQTDMDDEYGTASIAGNASVAAEDQLAVNNAFLNKLALVTNSIREGGMVRWTDMLEVMPEANYNNNIDMLMSNWQTLLAGRVNWYNESSSWNDATAETIAATVVKDSLPPALLSMLLSTAKITITPVTHEEASLNTHGIISPCNHRVTVLGFNSLTGNNDQYVSQNADKRLEQLFISTILPMITNNGLHTVYMVIDCNLTGHTVVDVALDGGHIVRKSSTTFCSSLHAPVLTNDAMLMSENATNMYTLCTDILSPGNFY